MDPKRALKSDLIYQCWQEHDLSYKLHECQLPVRDAIKKFSLSGPSAGLVFAALLARRYGKTTIMFTDASEFAMEANRLIRFVTNSTRQLKEIVYPIFRWLVSDFPQDMTNIPVWKEHSNTIIFNEKTPVESRIILHGCDDEDAIEGMRGTNAHRIYITEAGSIKRLKYILNDILMPQIMTTGGKILLDTTPPRDFGHYSNQILDRCESRGNIISRTIDDNTRIPESMKLEIIEEMGGLSSTTVQRELFVKRIPDSELAIVRNFDESRHVKIIERPAHSLFTHLDRYIPMDIGGWRHRYGILYFYYNFLTGKIYVEAETDIPGKTATSRLIADEIKKTTDRIWPGLKVYKKIADNNNQTTLFDLATEHGVSFVPVKKGALIAMSNTLDQWFKDDRIEIHPDCKVLIGNCKAGVWKEGLSAREDWAEHEVYGHFDMLASLMYGVLSVDTRRNPLPSGMNTRFDEVYLDPYSVAVDKTKAANFYKGLLNMTARGRN